MSDAVNKNVWRAMFGGTVVIVGLLVIFTVATSRFIVDPADRGQFGDQFGAINALFSGLAFLGLILTIAFQTRDLKAQTEALGLQQKALQLQIQEFQEQKEEMRRSAEAQENFNELTSLNQEIEVVKMWLQLEVTKISHDITSAKHDDLIRLSGIIDKLDGSLKAKRKELGLESSELLAAC